MFSLLRPSLLLAASLPAAAQAQQGGAVVERIALAMGTSLRMEVCAEDRGAALRASEAALQAVEAVEQRLSSWLEGSELSQLVRARVGEAFPASAELCADLRRASYWAGISRGAFDPAAGALVALYDLRGEGRWPDAVELEAAAAGSGIAWLEVRERQVVKKRGVQLDAGAFGKGAALDAAACALRAAGASTATLDFGGQLLFVGAEAATDVDVANPRDRSRPALRLRVRGGSVATTCNSERRRVVDGRPLGHVIDPRSGLPVVGGGSVTIWAPNAFDADCLSTACFVLGPEEALELVERLDGVEIVLMRCSSSSSELTFAVSSGLKGRVRDISSELEPH